MVELTRVLPIVVQFGVGGLLCVLGVWAGMRSGYLDLNTPDDRRLIGIVAGGFLALLLLYCMFTFWLPFLPGEAAS